MAPCSSAAAICRSVHRHQSGDGNARRASTPPTQHPTGIVRTVRAEIGLHQRELHQVELCAATADAFECAGNRFKRVDRDGEISPFESGKGARHCRNAGTGGITALARELVHLPCARLQRRVIASHDLSERDVHVGKGHAGACNRAVREVVRSCAMFRRHADARRVPSATETKPHRSPSRTAARCGHRVRRLP